MDASCMQKRWVDNPEGRACEIPYICVHANVLHCNMIGLSSIIPNPPDPRHGQWRVSIIRMLFLYIDGMANSEKCELTMICTLCVRSISTYTV